MKIHDYVIASEETLNHDFHATTDEIQVLNHGMMGIVTEVGELLENITNGTGTLNMAEELGDIAWYIAIFQRKYPVLVNCMIISLERNDAVLGNEELAIQLSIAASHLADDFKRLIYYGKPPKSFAASMGVVYSDSGLLECYEESIKLKLTRIIHLFCQVVQNNDLTIEDVNAANRAKLGKRHGKSFNAEGVFNRDITAENKAMDESLNTTKNV